MLKNYIITALRRLSRHPATTAINIAGLAAGLACAFLVLMYVKNETAYDRHHADADRIFRVNSLLTLEGKSDRIAAQSMRAGPELKEMFPEIESYVRVSKIGNTTIKCGDKMINESEMCLADSNLFDFFRFRILAGDVRTGIKKRNTIAISSALCARLFTSPREALGKSLRLPARSYEITLVYDENAYETHLPFHAYINLASISPEIYGQYMSDYFYMMSSTYVKLVPGTDVAALDRKLPLFYRNNIMPWIEENGVSGDMQYIFQPVGSVHLGSDYLYDFPGNTNRSYLYVFSWVGVFILLTACFNYMNLSTARYAKRAGETGIRKAIGAATGQLVAGFLSESILTAFFAAILAFAFAELFLPVFNTLTDKHFSSASLFRPGVLLPGLGIVLLSGLVAGSYPAFYLSRFKPALTLKMNRSIPASFGRGFSQLLHPSYIRKALVVFQFAVSGALMTATLVVYFQLGHMRYADPGFDRENILAVQVPNDTLLGRRFETIREELGRIPGVRKTGTSTNMPGLGYGQLYFKIEGRNKMENRFEHFGFVSPDWFDLMGIPIVAGRNFSDEVPSDAGEAFIINETAARMFHWDDPVGKRLENGFGMQGKVVGVMRDFHFKSMHNPVEPLVLMYASNPYGTLGLRLDGENRAQTLARVESVWKAFDHNHPMEYYFLDDALAGNYSREQKMLMIFGLFSVLTILISAFGLFGLAGFVTEQRTREIGIRKVMGSSVTEITVLLTKDFMKPVALSLLISVPLTAWAMHRWLEGFAFRIGLSPLLFILPAAAALLIALVTVTGTVMRAAKAPPVNALRHE